MKNFIKTVVFLAVFFGFEAKAALPFAFTAGRSALVAGRFAVQAMRPVLQAAKPNLLKLRAFAKANPKEVGVVGGAFFGGYNAKEGLIHTTIGAGLGAAAFLFPWSRALNAKQALALADAKKTISLLAPKLVELRTKLSSTQQGYKIALENLKNAGRGRTSGFGLGGNIPTAPSVVDQAKNLWSLWKMPKPSFPAGVTLPVLI